MMSKEGWERFLECLRAYAGDLDKRLPKTPPSSSKRQLTLARTTVSECITVIEGRFSSGKVPNEDDFTQEQLDILLVSELESHIARAERLMKEPGIPPIRLSQLKDLVLVLRSIPKIVDEQLQAKAISAAMLLADDVDLFA